MPRSDHRGPRRRHRPDRPSVRPSADAQRPRRRLPRQQQPGLHDRIGIERHALDALLHQPLREIGMVGRPLPADADVLASPCGTPGSPSTACAFTAASRSSKVAAIAPPESRSTPSVSCVMSLEPIEKPSKCSRNWSARIAFDGISHIMITRRPFSPRFRPFFASSSITCSRFVERAHERDHELDVGEAHVVAHALHRLRIRARSSRGTSGAM